MNLFGFVLLFVGSIAPVALLLLFATKAGRGGEPISPPENLQNFDNHNQP